MREAAYLLGATILAELILFIVLRMMSRVKSARPEMPPSRKLVRNAIVVLVCPIAIHARYQIEEFVAVVGHNLRSGTCSRQCLVVAVSFVGLADAKVCGLKAHLVNGLSAVCREHGLKLLVVGKCSSSCRDSPWRKDQKVEDVIRATRGISAGLVPYVGSLEHCASADYVLILDEDSLLMRGADAVLLQAALRAPKPICDGDAVTDGHGVFVPRMHQAFSACASTAGGDPMFDAFGESSFCGKGLVAVDAYLQCIAGRLPRELILSHDMIEGFLLRSARVESAHLIELKSGSVAVKMSQLHRWCVGDVMNILGMFVGRFSIPLRGFVMWHSLALLLSILATIATPTLLILLGICWGVSGVAVALGAAILVRAIQVALMRQKCDLAWLGNQVMDILFISVPRAVVLCDAIGCASCVMARGLARPRWIPSSRGGSVGVPGRVIISMFAVPALLTALAVLAQSWAIVVLSAFWFAVGVNLVRQRV